MIVLNFVKCLLIRGMVSPWKQVVYYDFDTRVDKELLDFLIKTVEATHANVRGIVCDMGNQSLLSEIGVYSEEGHFFRNPVNSERKVVVYPYVPHCIKNLKNHSLDYGMLYMQEDNADTYLGKTDFVHLLKTDADTLKFCPKLTIEHIEVKGSNRQRVFLATQLLSESVGKACSHLLGYFYQSKGKVILTIDKWFDVMNSRRKFESKEARCGLGKIFLSWSKQSLVLYFIYT